MPRTKYFDLTGQQFGRLWVVQRQSKVGGGPVVWSCKCECGNVVAVIAANLRNGTTNSCGCLRKEVASKKLTTHGLTKHPMYKLWSSMKTRCLNKNATNYSAYGGRGIGVCKRWMSFENFLNDMGERPEGTTLDRIDVNGDYDPKNCRWATPQEQGANRRQTKLINIQSFEAFLKKQSYLTKEQKKMLAINFFENQHR